MSRISDDHLDCAVYMYPTREAAKEGLKAGGSGFLVGIPSTQRPGNLYLYVVTNRHVIQGNSLVIRMNTINGSTEIFESDYSHWREHPDGDDIAVAPLVLRENTVKFSAVPFNMFVTADIIAEFDIGIGDDVYMIGRFVNHEGRQKNMPAVRFGNISVMPSEPIKQDTGYFQVSFAVEMRSAGGYSGSPVFVKIMSYDPGRKLHDRAIEEFRKLSNGLMNFSYKSFF